MPDAVSVHPEMFGTTEHIAAPTVLVDSMLVESPEQTGFNFTEFYDMMRSDGVSDEAIRGNTVHFSIGDGDGNLGLYFPEEHRTDIYVLNCIQEATQAARKGVPVKAVAGYKNLPADPVAAINKITIHESGHFSNDVMHPGYNSRIKLLKAGAVGVVLSPLPMAGDFLLQGSYPELMKLGIGAAFVAMGLGALTARKYNPMESPAWRFEDRNVGRSVVDFDISRAIQIAAERPLATWRSRLR